jgi:endonuclease V-like protein UPF0215 family
MREMIKKNIRALGIDDVPFKFRYEKSGIVGTVMRAPAYIEGVVVKSINVDGEDVTSKLIELLENSKFLDQIRVIFTNGITFGGFNVLDLEKVYDECSIPIITISRKMPDLKKIEDALKKHFSGWEMKLELMKKLEIHKIINNNSEIFAQYLGIEDHDAEKIINLFTVRGAVPEPIRISHIIASAIYFGESRSKV